MLQQRQHALELGRHQWQRNGRAHSATALIDRCCEYPDLGGVMAPRRVELDLERLIEPRRQQGCVQNRRPGLAVIVDPFDDRSRHSDQVRGNAAVHLQPPGLIIATLVSDSWRLGVGMKGTPPAQPDLSPEHRDTQPPERTTPAPGSSPHGESRALWLTDGSGRGDALIAHAAAPQFDYTRRICSCGIVVAGCTAGPRSMTPLETRAVSQRSMRRPIKAAVAPSVQSKGICI